MSIVAHLSNILLYGRWQVCEARLLWIAKVGGLRGGVQSGECRLHHSSIVESDCTRLLDLNPGCRSGSINCRFRVRS